MDRLGEDKVRTEKLIYFLKKILESTSRRSLFSSSCDDAFQDYLSRLATDVLVEASSDLRAKSVGRKVSSTASEALNFLKARDEFWKQVRTSEFTGFFAVMIEGNVTFLLLEIFTKLCFR